jgi:hypothetical protein
MEEKKTFIKKPAFKIGDKVRIANDLQTVFEVVHVHPDGKYDLKPITQGGATLTGVAELQMSVA